MNDKNFIPFFPRLNSTQKQKRKKKRKKGKDKNHP